MVEGFLHNPKATLIGADGAAMLLSLSQTGAWRWQASLEQVQSGWHQVSIESRIEEQSTSEPAQSLKQGDKQVGPKISEKPTESGRVVFAKRWVQVGTPPVSGETQALAPNESLLRQIASATSGAYELADYALLPNKITATTTEPLVPWLLPFIMALLLIEIALRGSSML